MGSTFEAETIPTPLKTRSHAPRLWPVHYKPLPDELLSCWLVRLAHGHGLKVQTFCNLIFGNTLQVWNRDIDRLGQDWLIRELAKRTGAQRKVVFGTTLRAYEGLLYRHFRSGGPLSWILVVQMYHRKRTGYGLQFCPTCLATDAVPYYRKCWRVALNTVCATHGTALLDRCPHCHSSIAVHRVDMSIFDWGLGPTLHRCHACGWDLRTIQAIRPQSYDSEASALLHRLSSKLGTDEGKPTIRERQLYAVLHHLCKTLASRYKHVQLRQYVLDCLRVPELPLTQGHVSFEMRPIEERHHLLQLAAWLLADLPARLKAAWLAKAIRYSVLLKDFPDRPRWYNSIVSDFSDWRLR